MLMLASLFSHACFGRMPWPGLGVPAAYGMLLSPQVHRIPGRGAGGSRGAHGRGVDFHRAGARAERHARRSARGRCCQKLHVRWDICLIA